MDPGPETMCGRDDAYVDQVQGQFTELSRQVETWRTLAARFDEFITTMGNHTRILQELLGKRESLIAPSHQMRLAPEERSEDQLELRARRISVEKASQEILDLFRKEKTLHYSDIASSLLLSMSTVIRACRLLQERGMIEGAASDK